MYQFFRNQQRLICFISKFKKFALCVAEKYMVWIFCTVLPVYDIIWIDLDDTSHVHIFWTNPWNYTNQNTFLLNGIYNVRCYNVSQLFPSHQPHPRFLPSDR